MAILVTGAAGFIGSNLVRTLRRRYPDEPVVSLDALTYAGNVENLADVWGDPMHSFVKGDVADAHLLEEIFGDGEVSAVFHLAAESHVDRSIVGPMAFVKTNVEGTATLLAAAARAWDGRSDVRFVHVSTDEVFGTLGSEGAFDENTPYSPRSPYSATKAASDHLARAWHETYGLPVLVTNCTNNYGPYQFPEKLIPVVVSRALAEEPVPVYGEGANVRDWIHVQDHCDGLCAVWDRGAVGETYCLGGEAELSNLELVGRVLDAVDRVTGRTVGSSRSLIRFVTDRPGHDFRYAMSIAKARRELGWEPRVRIDEGIESTVAWYADHQDWIHRSRTRDGLDFERQWYTERLKSATSDPEPPDRAPDEPTMEIPRNQIMERLQASGALERIGATDEFAAAETPLPEQGNE